jgi:hypothetical protein
MPKDVIQMIESAWAEVTDAHGQPAWMEPTTPSIDAQLAQRRARPHIGGASWGDGPVSADFVEKVVDDLWEQ